ncbi:hypothetical protein ACI2LF_16250 [Kribbella sp. NPDC020789]
MKKSPDTVVRATRRVAVTAALGLGLAVAVVVPAQAVTAQLVWDAPSENDCSNLMENIVADSKYCVPPDGSPGDGWDGYGYWR